MKLRLDLFEDDAFPLGRLVVYERRPGDDEMELCEEYFAGKRRSEVTRDSLMAAYHRCQDMSAIPSWLSDEAFAFFLPALMQVAIDGQDDLETQIPDLGATLGYRLLNMAKEGAASKRLAVILQTYSREQLAEVARGLQEFRDHDKNLWEEADEWEPAADALKLFWGQYLTGGEGQASPTLNAD